MNDKFSLSFKKILCLAAACAFCLTLTACAGKSTNETAPEKEPVAEQKGSMARTFTLIDELGRKSGTLVFDPLGGATLRDENDKVIGKFKAETIEVAPEEKKTEAANPEAAQVEQKPEAARQMEEPEEAQPMEEQQEK